MTDATGPATVRFGRGDYPRPVREVMHTTIPLADGTRLAARLWMPADAGPAARVPAVLEYVPYRHRDDTTPRDALVHPWFAGHGLAAVRVDIRGSGDSEGLIEDEYTPRELADACEVIAWLAAQEWCNGAVGMMGNSWGGFNALQVAALQPPALKAIITSCSTDDRYADDIHYMGGCLLNDNMKWAAVMFNRLGRSPDPDLVANAAALWRARLDNHRQWIGTWLARQRRDGFWKHGSVCEDYGRIRVPVFAVGGWNDGYSNAIPRLMAGLSVPRLAWIGQWSHNYPHLAKPGPAVGFLQEAVRWWERWLKGIPNGIDEGPMLRAVIQDPTPPTPFLAAVGGRWVEEAAWPPPGLVPRRLHLRPGGLLADARGPAATVALCSPLVPGHHARWCAHGAGADFPGDQRAEDGGAAVFETAPLAAGIDLLGAPEVTLAITSDRPQAMIAARLSDVAPDGAATRVTYGLLNLAHRDSHETPAPLVPGREHVVRLKLNDLGQHIAAGHRLRLALSTSLWPIAWPSPERATLGLRLDGCHLDLPVRPPRPGDGAHRPPAEVHLPEDLAITRLTPARDRRWVETDLASQVTTSLAEEDSGTIVWDDSGWTTTIGMKQAYSIRPDDPLSARAEVQGWQSCSRGDWRIETRTRTVMTADATTFHVAAEFTATENGHGVLERRWDHAIPRDNV